MSFLLQLLFRFRRRLSLLLRSTPDVTIQP